MRGIISAGHELTANAGKEMLERGGNAFDAALAATFASFVCEPALTSMGGGGFLMAHIENGPTLLYDFFPDVPGKGRKINKDHLRFFPVDIDFSSATQRFHIGQGAIAVPGCMAGMSEIYERHCTLPLKALLGPAYNYAKNGVIVNTQQGYFIKILSPILTASKESRDIYAPGGNLLQEGDKLFNKDIAGTIEHLMSDGLDSFYRGAMTDKILDSFGNTSLITDRDMKDYKVMIRTPLEVEYRKRKIYTNPPPSSGGCLIAFSLKLLEEYDLHKMGHNKHLYLKYLLGAMKATDEARKERFDHMIYDENIADAFMSKENLSNYRKRITEPLGVHNMHRASGSGNTTHISVLDESGNAASVTTSNGEGCGFLLPGTGIMMNNMMGEEDINPNGFFTQQAGTRMSSMMAPTIVINHGLPEIVLGSGGSNRIRNVIVQVILNVIDHQLSVSAAVNAPRCHLEGDIFHVEQGIAQTELTDFGNEHIKIKKWGQQYMFFGGAHTVAMNKSKNLFSGKGDFRRGGVCLYAG